MEKSELGSPEWTRSMSGNRTGRSETIDPLAISSPVAGMPRGTVEKFTSGAIEAELPDKTGESRGMVHVVKVTDEVPMTGLLDVANREGIGVDALQIPLVDEPAEAVKLRGQLKDAGWTAEQVARLCLVYAHLNCRMAIVMLDCGATHNVLSHEWAEVTGAEVCECATKSVKGLAGQAIGVIGISKFTFVLGAGNRQRIVECEFLVVDRGVLPVPILAATDMANLNVVHGPGPDCLIIGEVPCGWSLWDHLIQ